MIKAMELAGSAEGSEFLELDKGECDRFLPERRSQHEDLRKGLSTGKNLGGRPS